MSDEIMVETTYPHRNLHGEKLNKEIGDTYPVPPKVALRLMACDLVKLPEEPKKPAAKRRRKR